MKVQITLNDDLMKRADAYADDNYMTRSGLISQALTQYLNSVEMTRAIIDMALSIRKIADCAEKGTVSDDMLHQLEELEILSKMLIEANSKK